MKKYFGKLTMVAALALSLALGVAAFAESVDPVVPESPTTESTEAAAPEQSEAASDTAANDAALKAAMDAWSDARDAARQERLEDELKGYVESGKLTQEQADLILDYFNNREPRQNSKGGNGKGGCLNGRMNGRNGFNGGMRNNGGAKGAQGGRFNPQQMPNRGAGAKGTAFNGEQTQPDTYTDGSI